MTDFSKVEVASPLESVSNGTVPAAVHPSAQAGLRGQPVRGDLCAVFPTGGARGRGPGGGPLPRVPAAVRRGPRFAVCPAAIAKAGIIFEGFPPKIYGIFRHSLNLLCGHRTNARVKNKNKHRCGSTVKKIEAFIWVDRHCSCGA